MKTHLRNFYIAAVDRFDQNNSGLAAETEGLTDLAYASRNRATDMAQLEGELHAAVNEPAKATLNPDLTIHGVVLTMYDARNNLAGQVVADVRQFMGEKVYETVIPRNVRVSEAPSYGKPVLLYDLKCNGSQAYLRLASEIIQREKALRAA